MPNDGRVVNCVGGNRVIPLLLLLLPWLSLGSCEESASLEGEVAGFQALSEPYFGQQPPLQEAELFMPGLISTHGRNGNISFLDGGSFCVFTSDETGTRFTYLQDGQWMAPQRVPWGNEQRINDYSLGGDGKTFFWQSRNLTHEGDTLNDLNIWRSTRLDHGWTEPTPLPEVVNHPDFGEHYPSVAADGTVYYFYRDWPGSQGTDIYRNRFEDDSYLARERLGWPINSAYGEFDFFVAPDESYLIFASDRPGGYGQCDNYISFRRDDGQWTHAINMGSRINSYAHEIRSFVSHDGKALFFGSTREADVDKGEDLDSELAAQVGDNDVYWIDARVVAELRATMLAKKCAAEVVRAELELDGTASAITKMQELFVSESGRYYFSLFELLEFCARLLENGRVDEAERFYAAMLETFDTFRVKHGYAVVLASHGNPKRAISLLVELQEAGEEIDLATSLDFLFYDLKANDKLEDAIYVLQQRIEMFPDSYFAYCYLASIHASQGDTERAIDACEKAIEMKPGFQLARRILKGLRNR